MSSRQKIPWWLVCVMLVMFWPVGIAMLVYNLFFASDAPIPVKRGGTSGGGFRKGGYRSVEVPYKSTNDPVGGKLGKPDEERPRGESSPMVSLRRGKVLRGVGIGATVFGMVASIITFFANISSDWYGLFEALALSAIPFAAIGIPGIAVALWGNSTVNRAQTLLRYTQMIGQSPEVSIDRLAGAIGAPYGKVYAELSGLVNKGDLPGYYIDSERRALIRGPLRQQRQNPPQQEQKREEPQQRELPPDERIKRIGMTIADSEVRQKVFRLSDLAGRIYSYTEAYPEKDRLAAAFKDRYIPMTIKILESYSHFEKSGSSGRNVRDAMNDVEAVLDTLLSSYEKQLDMLYMDEALDVSTDIDVLERMINGDGLGESPFEDVGSP